MAPDPNAAAPPYPQYPDLLARARREAPRFVSPQHLADYRRVVTDRGHDWCTAVLGRPFPGLRSLPVLEVQLLILADAAGLTPPLPAAVLADRERRAARDAELAARRQALAEADAARWAQALAACGVEVQVRPNTRGRRTGTELRPEPLRHAVPLVDARSGPTARPRLHPAGRAVCETVGRARPRQLGDPTDAPVTCVSCLTLVPQLRP